MSPKSEQALTVDLVRESLESGNVDAAKTMVQEILIRNPSDPEAIRVSAQIEAAKSNFSAAADHLLELAESQQQNRLELVNEAAVYLHQAKQYQRCIQVLEALVQQFPDSIESRRKLAALLNARGFRFDANEHLRLLCSKEVALSPRELTGLLNPVSTWVTFAEKPDHTNEEFVSSSGTMNVVAALRSNGDVREALELLQKSELVSQKNPAAIAMLGWLLASSQDFDGLRKWAEDASKEVARYPAYWMGLGSLMLQAREVSAASHCFFQAVRLEPGCEEAIDGMLQSVADQSRPDLESRLLERKKTLAKIQTIAAQISQSRVPNPAMANDLGKLLNSVGRPMESLAWQESLYAAVAPQSQQVRTIRAHKPKVLKRYPTGRVELEIVCGVEEQDFASVDQFLRTLKGVAAVDPEVEAVAFPKSGTPVFKDVAPELGVRFTYKNAAEPVSKHFRLHEALGAGVAWIDFDRDGWVDLYVGQGGCDPPEKDSDESNLLYRNLNKSFGNVTKAARCQDFGYTQGVTCGDINQDGFQDLVVGNFGLNRILINQGDGTFQDRTDELSRDTDWKNAKYTSSIAVADVTGDGLPDIFEATYVDDEKVLNPIKYDAQGKPVLLPGPKHFMAGADRLFASTPSGGLKNVTLGGATDQVASTGLGLLITDLDADGRNDIFVANDQASNHWWRRDAKQWQESAAAAGLAFGVGGQMMACMGIAAADFDGNGMTDLHITNFVDESSNLYLQKSQSLFVDQSFRFEMDRPTVPMVGFGTQVLDFDNNSSPDLIVANGHIEDFREKGQTFQMPTQILVREAKRFRTVVVQGDDAYWGKSHLGRAVAVADWNNDGRVDAGVSDLKRPFALLQNETRNSGAFLQLELIGCKCARDAVGTRVEVELGGRKLHAVSKTGDGYFCKNESMLHFGLGKASQIQGITITWSSGSVWKSNSVPVNQRLTVIENELEAWSTRR